MATGFEPGYLQTRTKEDANAMLDEVTIRKEYEEKK